MKFSNSNKKILFSSQALPSKMDFHKNGKESNKLMQHILGSNTEEIEMEIESKPNEIETIQNMPSVTFNGIKDILNRK